MIILEPLDMNPINEPQVTSSTTSPEPEWRDPVIEAYKKDVDRTLLRENLKLTVEERFQKFQSVVEFATELREAGRRARSTR